MAFIIRCKDVGENCDYVVQGKSEDEVYNRVLKHLKEVHGMKKLPADRNRALIRLIREDKAA